MKAHNALIPLLLAAALSLPGALRAADVSGGIKAGLNISDFVGSDASPAGGSKAQAAGLAIGGYLIFPLTDIPFRLQAECLVAQKGATYKGDVLGEHFESRLRLTYLEFPILARFDIDSRSGAKPAILLGPTFGIKVSARAETHTIGASDSGNVDNVKAFDPGIMLGGSVDIPAGAGAVVLDARYTRSLTTIYDKAGGTTADVKNSVISILLGYRF